MIEYLYSGALGAGATMELLTDNALGRSKQARPKRPTRYVLAIVHESAAGDISFEVTTDNRVLVPRSYVPCGGTVGVYPNIDQQAFKFDVAAFEELSIKLFDDSGAGGGIVMATLMSEPLA